MKNRFPGGILKFGPLMKDALVSAFGGFVFSRSFGLLAAGKEGLSEAPSIRAAGTASETLQRISDRQ